ncbi:MAG: PIN domain-containing protein [Verrucomicrobia bacterium]|nr:PIN domain-containing protein [Verrucomicrobiota bacterium]
MIVFLDTSTILAACWSAKGLSRLLIKCAATENWTLVTADYCVSEVEKNVHKHRAGAADWRSVVHPRIKSVGSVYVIDRPIVFDATKDRPVILSAIGSNAEYLVTSDTTDFSHVLGTVVYGVNIRTPKAFLLEMGIVE